MDEEYDEICTLEELMTEVYCTLEDDSAGGYRPNRVRHLRDDVEAYTSGVSDQERVKELSDELATYYNRREFKIYAGKHHFTVCLFRFEDDWI